MNKQAFLHISDIHISDFEESHSGNNILSNFSKFQKYSDVFINDLKDHLKKNNIDLKTVLISGDLANSGEEEEYVKIEKFLLKIKNEFSLNITDILIVPGNHDINRFECQKAWRDDNKSKKPYEYHTEKYKYFKDFFDNFYNDRNFIFEPSQPISIFKTYDENKLCFIGLNSCYKESFEGKNHYGFINEDNLEDKLKELSKSYKDYRFIAFFHHNPHYIGDESKTLKNWAHIRCILEKYNIRNYLFGHQHKDESQKIVEKEEFCYFSVGSLGKLLKDDMHNSYNLFVEETISYNKLHYKRYLFKFMIDSSDKYLNTGYWERQDNIKDYRDLIIISTNKGFSPSNKEESSLDKTTPLNANYQTKSSIDITETICTDNEKKLIEIIKSNQLIRSGHFHWSDNRKTRTWIDTNKLLSSKEVLSIIRNDFIEKINNINIEKSINIDLIMGLGIEGNIIASPLAIVYNSYYSYYPVPTRNDHNEFEKKIIEVIYKNIVLVTDVIFEGLTIMKFVKKNKKLFDIVDNLIIFGVFFTGDMDITSRFKADIGKDIIFRYITNKIKIEKCNIEKEHCLIYNYKLETIYEF